MPDYHLKISCFLSLLSLFCLVRLSAQPIDLPAAYRIDVIRSDEKPIIDVEADSVWVPNGQGTIGVLANDQWLLISGKDSLKVDTLKSLPWGGYRYHKDGKSFFHLSSLPFLLELIDWTISKDGHWLRGTDASGYLQTHIPSGFITRLLGEVSGKSAPFVWKDESQRTHLIDANGQLIANSSHPVLIPIADGRFWIAGAFGSMGLLNREGKWVIRRQFRELRPASDRVLIGWKDTSWLILDFNGHIISTHRSELRYQNGLIQWKTNFGIGAADSLGCQLADTARYGTKAFQNHYVSDFGTHFTIRDTNAALMLPGTSRFTWVSDGGESLFYVRRNGKFGFSNREGIIRIPCRYQNAGIVSSDRVPVKINGIWGVVNRSDELLTQLAYDTIASYCGGYTIAKKKGQFLLLGLNGKELNMGGGDSIVETPFDSFLIRAKEKFGLVSKEGFVSFQPVFDEITPLSADWVRVKLGKYFALYSSSGEIKYPARYQKIIFDRESDCLFLYR